MADISIAMATYNGAQHVEEQLDSILEQRLRPTEIVVADDGSEDGTLALVRQLAETKFAPRGIDVRLLAPSPSPIGPAANFVRAIYECHAPLIALSDQDDIWKPNRLSEAASQFELYPNTEVVGSDAELVDAAGSPLGLSVFDALRRISRNGDPDLLAAVIRSNFLPGMTLTLTAGMARSYGTVPKGWLHDHWFCLAAASRSNLRVVPDALVLYRQHQRNAVGVSRQISAANPRHWIRRRVERQDSSKWTSAEAAVRELIRTAPNPNKRLLERKLELELTRAELPPHRVSRLPIIARQVANGNYSRVARRGLASASGDLLSRA